MIMYWQKVILVTVCTAAPAAWSEHLRMRLIRLHQDNPSPGASTM